MLIVFLFKENSNIAIKNGFICIAILKNEQAFGEIGFYRDINQNETLSCSCEIDCQAGELIYLYTYAISEYQKMALFYKDFLYLLEKMLCFISSIIIYY